MVCTTKEMDFFLLLFWVCRQRVAFHGTTECS